MSLSVLLGLSELYYYCRSVVIRLVHLDVEDTSEELLSPALLCHKEPARSRGLWI